MQLIAVVTTVAKPEDARRLAHEMVQRGLAACAQISVIESVYRWQGKVHNESEYRIVFKAPAARYDDIERVLLGLHPYDLPEIHAVALDRVYAPYGEWVGANSVGDARPA